MLLAVEVEEEEELLVVEVVDELEEDDDEEVELNTDESDVVLELIEVVGL